MRIMMVLTIWAVWGMQSALADEPVTTNKLVNQFMSLDKNGDGVSFAEFMAMVEARAKQEYQRMDSNRDGRVSRYEYKVFWDNEKAKYYRVKR